MKRGTRRDWAGGPAKWFAVFVLGVAAVVGMTWAAVRRPVRVEVVRGERGRVAEAVKGAPEMVNAGEGEGGRREPQAGTSLLPAGGTPAPLQPAAPVLTGTMDINRATAAELELLPGIGPALAARIIEDRAKNGAYKTTAQLDRVAGIGPKKLAKILPLIRVEGE
ncbi:hypothetical protein BH11PLA1_BH11PLA1_07070 [soil metagenome]